MFTRRLLALLTVLLLLGWVLPTGAHTPVNHSLDDRDFQVSSTLGALSPQTATLFTDDFESGTDGWNLDSNWSVVTEGSNHVLDGSSHAWASLITGQNWSDYTFTVKVKMISGAVHLMFRMSDERGRYILGLHPGGMYLRRESPWEKFSGDLATDTNTFVYNTWYTIKIEADVQQLRVYVNGTPRLIYQDSFGDALWSGSIGLEVVGSGTPHARFDDVSVVGVATPVNTWVKTGGPIGGLGYDVRYGSSDRRILYVTDNYSGVNKSTDGGKTWFATNRGITARFGSSGDAIPIFALTVDPNNPNNLWAGLKDVKGIYKSTNAGQNWADVTPTIPEAQFVFRGFAVQKGNSNIVYAAGEIPTGVTGKTFDKVKGRVYRTTDGGQNWTAIWEGENLARYVLIRPDNPNVIYVSTGIFDREANNSNCSVGSPPSNPGGVGVLKGVFNGSTWNWTAFNTSNGLTDLYVGSLVMHPTNPDILLAGTGNNACSNYQGGDGKYHSTGGVFLTTNGGQTWHHTLTDEAITSVEFSPSNPNIAYAGGQNRFYISEDGGWTWTMVAGQSYPWGPPGVQAGFPIDILVDPEAPNTLFVNNYGGGSVKSLDGGETWTLASQGYTGALMLDVAISPNSPGTVFGTARSGAFRSNNGGSTWTGLSYAPANLPTAYAVAIKPDNPQVVLTSHELLGWLYRSTDGGNTWTAVYQLPGIIPGDDTNSHGFKRIVFAPSNNNVVYAGSCRGSVALQAGHTVSKGVYKSTDGGVNWMAANDANIADKCINDLAVHPNNPNLVYAATASGGLYKSTDGGANWGHLGGLSALDVRAVAVKPDQPNIVVAGTHGNGVYISTNAGSSWTQMSAGMEPNDAIWSLVFDPINPDWIWAGSFRTGVYRFDPSENMWTHVNAGLRTRAVVRLAISADGTVLYAATSGEGVFRLGNVPVWRVYLPLAEK